MGIHKDIVRALRWAGYRGFVTADVLMKGLSRGAIAMG